MKYLYKFNLKEFNSFVHKHKLKTWWIYDNLIKERYSSVENSDYIKILNKFAIDNNINFNKTEIISWIDNISILYAALKYATKIKENLQLTILGELHIPFSRQRCDIVLLKDNKVLLIELSYKRKDIDEKYKYEQKLTQVMFYKELLSNVLPKHIEIATYSFAIKPETDSYGNQLECKSNINGQHTYTNHDDCFYLGKFIAAFFENTNKSALEELESYSDDTLINLYNK